MRWDETREPGPWEIVLRERLSWTERTIADLTGLLRVRRWIRTDGLSYWEYRWKRKLP